MASCDCTGSDDSTTKRKRKRQKLLVAEKVEVRSLEDGLHGSWHPGTVLACKDNIRHVVYDYILSDIGEGNATDTVVVTRAIDGLVADDEARCEHRGIIRPSPPFSQLGIWNLQYGLCVDAWYNEAWWEGVIFDHEDGSDERRVFFPDLGDEIQFEVGNLRITQDWDEVTGGWEHRGSWIFLELIEEFEQEAPLFVSVKQIWYDLREKKSFDLIKEWTFHKSSLWKGLVLEAINDHLSPTMNELCREFENFRDNVSEAPDQAPKVTNESDQSKSRELDIRENSEDVSINSFDDDCSSSRSLCVIQSRRTVSSMWIPVGRDVVPGAKFFPDSVTQYSQLGPKNRKSETALAKKVRMHLLHLGWEISSAEYNNTQRLRYMSPSGKVYYSLLKLCKDLHQRSTTLSPMSQLDKRYSSVSPNDQSPSQESNKPKARERELQIELPPFQESNKPDAREEEFRSELPLLVGSDANDLVPEYSPKAPVNWINHVKNKSIATNTRKKYSLQAKKHLLALGWRFDYIQKTGINHKTRNELRYVSPAGKWYITLLAACQYCVDHMEDLDHQSAISLPIKGVNMEKDTESPVRRNELSSAVNKMKSEGSLIRQNSDDRQDGLKLGHLSKGKKQTKEKSLYEDGNKCTSRVLRSSKRTERVVAHAKMPRTVLSWLIDNNVILPREKIYYQNQDDHSTLEGRITRDGIKCGCCQKIFTLGDFEIHAGSNLRRPAANIFLPDGRSLLECQIQMVKKYKKGTTEHNKTKSSKSLAKSDDICTVCQYGGELILCDQCPSAFHKECVGLKGVPEGDWFCQSCCCAICTSKLFHTGSQHNTDSNFRDCDQCEQRYHVGCLRKIGSMEMENCPKGNWFCSRKCQMIYAGLHELLGKEIVVGPDNLTWSLLKHSKLNWGERVTQDTEHKIETFCKLNIALGVMHECFETVLEARTRTDLVEDVIFNRWSDLNRLKFTGFYTILLERNGELITVATLRVFGDKAAEIPLVATRHHYRRMGMCGVLISELEKQLMDLGVDKLVLPSVTSAFHTWTSSFGFSKMTSLDKSALLGYTFLGFPGTVMCQKLLRNNESARASVFKGVQQEACDNNDGGDADKVLGPCSLAIEVFQEVADRTLLTDIVNRGHIDSYVGHSSHASRTPSLPIASPSANHENGAQEHSSDADESSKRHKRKAEANSNKQLIYYKRRRVLKLPQITSIPTY